jgi:hypothetical protein
MHLPKHETARPLWQDVVYFASMVAILIFANWAGPEEQSGIWYQIYQYKWYLTSASALVFWLSL